MFDLKCLGIVEKVNEVLFLESDRIDWFTLLDDHGTEITEGITSELEFNFETLDVNGRNALHTAVIKNDPDLIKVLLSKGVRTDLASKSGWTIYHYASRNPTLLCMLLSKPHCN